MLLSELLDSTVLDKDGVRLGTVVDVRFRRAARRGRHEGDLELIALIVSPHTHMSMYGYERGRMEGPAAIARGIGWLHRRSRIIPWECVQRVDEGTVVLGVRPPRIPLDVRAEIPADADS